ncbi:Cbb3-type cytochrome c oxidase subunit FixP [Rhodospirillaceae bacterium LM-1]|nr:Cbb3-type cytochrome c oxidase subunit FixP [Rhodospirillaceae bacterium LM-1]
MANVEKDLISGQNTTGHEWDGIKELDTPLPKWWVYIFWACIVWSIGYYVVYPSIPFLGSYTKGMFQYSSRNELTKDLAAQAAQRGAWLKDFQGKEAADIAKDEKLLRYAMAGGKAAFNENCAPCHGVGGAGSLGFANLTDDEWIWGGKLEQIQQTITHGIRSDDADGRMQEMTKFGVDGVLKAAEIDQVADFIVGLSTGKADAAAPGAQLFADNCVACHGEGGVGNQDMGAPALNNAIFTQVKGDKASIVAQVTNPKHGVMPAWGARLPAETIKMLAIYVHSLGGGQK